VFNSKLDKFRSVTYMPEIGTINQLPKYVVVSSETGLISRLLQIKPKALSFQVRSGWKLACLFFQSIDGVGFLVDVILSRWCHFMEISAATWWLNTKCHPISSLSIVHLYLFKSSPHVICCNAAAPTSSVRDVTPVSIENRPTTISVNWQPPRQTNGQITGMFYVGYVLCRW